MTGQDAVNSAKAFNDRLAITGAILTKMDGDARGGAALSIRQITGAPIKFLGTGEKPDAFEPFHPDRIVSRIMGMGDIATLLERAEEKLDRGKAEALRQEGPLRRGLLPRRLPRTAPSDQEDGLHEVHPQDAALRRPLRRHGPGRRERRRKPVHPRRIHHQLHDQQGAPATPTSSTAAAASASPPAPAPPSRRSTTSSANTPRCPRCSKPWAADGRHQSPAKHAEPNARQTKIRPLAPM